MVFPLHPVMSATGTSCTSDHATSEGSGSADTGHMLEPRPVPTEAVSSSDRKVTPRASAASRSARSRGFRSAAMASRSRAATSPSGGADSPASSATAASQAPSLTSVAAYSASTGALIARLAPPSKCRPASCSPSHPTASNSFRACARQAAMTGSGGWSPSVTSMTAPGRGPRRLGPVRRRESSRRGDPTTVSRPLRGPAAPPVRRAPTAAPDPARIGEAPEGPARPRRRERPRPGCPCSRTARSASRSA